MMMLMGGGVRGGQVYSQWPTLAPDALIDGDLAITTDYRDVLAEIISQRLGNAELDEVFPGHNVDAAWPGAFLEPRGCACLGRGLFS